jgi:hypothetical protein
VNVLGAAFPGLTVVGSSGTAGVSVVPDSPVSEESHLGHPVLDKRDVLAFSPGKFIFLPRNMGTMGLFDRFTSDSSPAEDDREPRSEEYVDGDNYQAEAYTREELSDEVSVIFADRWPTGKPFSDYELIYASDSALDDPILLRCAVKLFIPKGTKLLPFEDMAGLEIEAKTYWTSHAQLINPKLASFIDYDWDYKAPDAMHGRVVEQRQPDGEEAEFLKLLISAMEGEFNE